MNPDSLINTNTKQSKFIFDSKQINEVAEQFYASCNQDIVLGTYEGNSLGIPKPATAAEPNVSKPLKTLVKHFQAVYASEYLKKGGLNKSKDTSTDFAFVVDARKQEPFDWKKTTNAYQRIVHLADLEDKWDGYNAPIFSKEQINIALDVYSKARTYAIDRGLNFSKVEPFIAPCSDGSILFEWAGKRFPSRQLEVYIPKEREAEQSLEYLKSVEDSEEEEEEGKVSLNKLYHVLDWLFKLDGR
ncbi:MAG: hypothetical protein AB1589_07435 [Cyanobacteriota bacterium]